METTKERARSFEWRIIENEDGIVDIGFLDKNRNRVYLLKVKEQFNRRGRQFDAGYLHNVLQWMLENVDLRRAHKTVKIRLNKCRWVTKLEHVRPETLGMLEKHNMKLLEFVDADPASRTRILDAWDNGRLKFHTVTGSELQP